MTSSCSQVVAHHQQHAIIQEVPEAQKINHRPFRQSLRKDLDLACAARLLLLICKDLYLHLLRSPLTAHMASTNPSGSINSLGYLELA